MGEARMVIDEMKAPRALGGDEGRVRRSLLVAGAGLATGGLTLLGQGVLDAEWNRLANSGAIWLAVAFVVGSRMASDREAFVAGTATLLFALVGYEVAARVTGASISVAGLVIWSGTALVGGPVYGFAGRRWRVGVGRDLVLAVALLGAVFVAEGAYTLLAIPDLARVGLVEVVVGFALPVVLGRGGRERVAGFALLVPIACAGLLVSEGINRLFLAG
jgi:hypothetical protein